MKSAPHQIPSTARSSCVALVKKGCTSTRSVSERAGAGRSHHGSCDYMGLLWIRENPHSKLVQVLICLLVLVAGSLRAAAQVDGRLMQQFRGNLSDPRGSLSDWRESTFFCKWSGVTCANGTQHVIGISLSKKALQGPIPSVIGLLQGLQVLDLSKNDFNGSIPGEITRCTQLTDINLSDNSLSGTIPGDIGLLTNLTNLRLSGNNLEGSIPASIGRLTKLKRLRIFANQLNGSIPREIGNCTALNFLQVYSNKLQGAIPAEIGKLRGLTHLSLFQNRLSGSVPKELAGCMSLSRLSLASNNLTGEFPPLDNITGLTELDISQNQLSGQLPQGIGTNWKELETMNISLNNFSGAIPESFGEMVSLNKLDLSSNNFSGQLPVRIGLLSKLSVVLLFGNSFRGVLPPALGMMSSLQELNVSNNEFSGVLPAGLCNTKNLTLLDLSSNQIGGDLVPLENCSSLVSFDASNNRFNGSFPSLISTSLNFLDLSSNRLEGPIAPQIDQLRELKSLLLANNKLWGRLPDGIGVLPKLEALNISRNSINGPLPNLAALTSLHTLDLSYNSFSGRIPDYLGTFTTLQTLDVSNNQFSGNIPQIKASMPASAFMNNLNLCGPPLSAPCNGQQPPGAAPPPRRSRRKSIARKVGLAFIVIGGAFLAATAMFLLYSYMALKRKKPTVIQENKFADRVPLLYTEIEKATEGFSDANVIGTGPHGAVYKGIFAWEKILAVKVIRTEQEAEENNKNAYYFTSAARKLNRIRHPNVVKLEEFLIYKGAKIFLYEYMPNRSLAEALHRPAGPKLHWNNRYKIALGAAQGLSYLHHQHSIVHCDIKSNNLLLDSAFGARIADIGLAKLIKDTRNLASLNKSLGYTAPEPVKVSQKADVYSFGVVLLELLTGRRPIMEDGTLLVPWVRDCIADDQPLSDLVDPILRNVNGPFQEEICTVCKIALICTDISPTRRPSMKEVVEVLSRIRKEPGGPKLRSLRSFIHRRSFVLSTCK